VGSSDAELFARELNATLEVDGMTQFVAAGTKSIGAIVQTTSHILRGIARFPETLATAIERWAVK
jgi:hypothetical protein